MAKKDFVWDYKAAGDLMLRSSEITAICEDQAEKMTRVTGVEYIPDVRMGNQRVIVSGRKTVDKTDSESTICPKCGEYHPNCKCISTRKRGR